MIYSPSPELQYKPHFTTWILDPKYDLTEGIRNSALAEWTKQFCKDGVVLDLNAGYGELALTVAEVASKVVVVEANREVYYALCGNIFLNNWCPRITAYNYIGDLNLNFIPRFVNAKIEQLQGAAITALLEKHVPTVLVQGEKTEVETYFSHIATPLAGQLYKVIPVQDCPDFWLATKIEK
jgi:hypothetical protein